MSTGKARKVSSSRKKKHDIYGSRGLDLMTMTREASKATRSQTRDLWDKMDAYKDGKITKKEWEFVMGQFKQENNGQDILKEEDSVFLFQFLDKNSNKEITKMEFESLFNDVVAKNPGMGNHVQVLRAAHNQAVAESKRMGGIDYKLQKFMTATANALGRIVKNMDSASEFYAYLKEVCENPPPRETKDDVENEKDFYDGYRVFDSPKKMYASDIAEKKPIIDLGEDRLKLQYTEMSKELDVAEAKVLEVNNLVQYFVEQGSSITKLKKQNKERADLIEYLEERDSHCCRFACLLCC